MKIKALSWNWKSKLAQSLRSMQGFPPSNFIYDLFGSKFGFNRFRIMPEVISKLLRTTFIKFLCWLIGIWADTLFNFWFQEFFSNLLLKIAIYYVSDLPNITAASLAGKYNPSNLRKLLFCIASSATINHSAKFHLPLLGQSRAHFSLEINRLDNPPQWLPILCLLLLCYLFHHYHQDF